MGWRQCGLLKGRPSSNKLQPAIYPPTICSTPLTHLCKKSCVCYFRPLHKSFRPKLLSPFSITSIFTFSTKQEFYIFLHWRKSLYWLIWFHWNQRSEQQLSNLFKILKPRLVPAKWGIIFVNIGGSTSKCRTYQYMLTAANGTGRKSCQRDEYSWRKIFSLRIIIIIISCADITDSIESLLQSVHYSRQVL